MQLYLRKEPTNDKLTLRQPAPLSRAQRDVVIYRDKAATKPIGRYLWFYSNKPDRRRSRLMFNCAQYAVLWLADLEMAR